MAWEATFGILPLSTFHMSADSHLVSCQPNSRIFKFSNEIIGYELIWQSLPDHLEDYSGVPEIAKGPYDALKKSELIIQPTVDHP
jgi:hypothetical protein